MASERQTRVTQAFFACLTTKREAFAGLFQSISGAGGLLANWETLHLEFFCDFCDGSLPARMFVVHAVEPDGPIVDRPGRSALMPLIDLFNDGLASITLGQDDVMLDEIYDEALYAKYLAENPDLPEDDVVSIPAWDVAAVVAELAAKVFGATGPALRIAVHDSPRSPIIVSAGT